MREPLKLGPYPTAEQLLPATLQVLKDEQTRMESKATALFELYPEGGDDPDRQGASYQRMSEAYKLTVSTLVTLVLDHNRRITRATNPHYAKLSDAEIDKINAGFENY